MGEVFMRSIAVIAALNEEKKIARLVGRTLSYVDSVLVVDDGSFDGTAALAEKAGARVLSLGRNTGKANAVREGLKHCDGYDAVVLMDGDGQHLPEEIPLLLGALESSDFAVGSRFLQVGEGMPLKNKLSNRTASVLLSLLVRQRITDPQSGFRAIRGEKVKAMELEAERYALEHIMLLEAGRLGLKIAEVPTSTVYGEEKSHIKPFSDTLNVIVNIIKFVLRV